MKKGFLALAIFCGLMTACVDVKKEQVKGDINAVMDSVEVEMVQLCGTVGDGTSMHSLEFISDEGDTLYLTYDNNAIGGLASGDRAYALFCDNNGEFEALSVINVSSLAHLWKLDGEDNQHLELSPTGNATTYGMDENYNGWLINNGELILEGNGNPDIYKIGLLTEQELILEADSKTMKFTRKN